MFSDKQNLLRVLRNSPLINNRFPPMNHYQHFLTKEVTQLADKKEGSKESGAEYNTQVKQPAVYDKPLSNLVRSRQGSLRLSASEVIRLPRYNSSDSDLFSIPHVKASGNLFNCHVHGVSRFRTSYGSITANCDYSLSQAFCAIIEATCTGRDA